MMLLGRNHFVNTRQSEGTLLGLNYLLDISIIIDALYLYTLLGYSTSKNKIFKYE